MNGLGFNGDKKITISFSNFKEVKFAVINFDEEELKKIISQFNNGNLMKVRNIFINPKNVDYFEVEDLEEDLKNEV
jgi:hypothetical protein